jgi:hypothetical protein
MKILSIQQSVKYQSHHKFTKDAIVRLVGDHLNHKLHQYTILWS